MLKSRKNRPHSFPRFLPFNSKTANIYSAIYYMKEEHIKLPANSCFTCPSIHLNPSGPCHL